MNTKKLTARDTLTKMPSGWVLVDLLTKKMKLRCIKSTLFWLYYLFEMVRIRISVKKSDPDPNQIKKHDPDLYQSEMQDPDLDQKGLGPQH
jgi:hypothetical protein